ncbi:bifunctional levopimaradiene synthase, chloroplastic isoform X2 [Cryptomeria japonica]|uniref:bifunctional levopimaradiene synthase, chloroplastic isoform X2 n=1 Tax=Cryptomeria japonica TaxID=3369 RepID=UPI0025ACC54C|nr:bifunctional levopimaradiene synthase, chloroplastic isoform X2 [Cryptomeria japonica]
MAEILSSSLGLSHTTQHFQWRTSYNTKRRLVHSNKRRLHFIRAKIGVTSFGFEGELQIRYGDIDHKAFAPSTTQSCKPKAYPSTMWGGDFICSVVAKNAEATDKTIGNDDKRIEVLVREIKEKFNSMEDGEISPSAYDTAWLARLPAIDGSHEPLFPQTLNWIIDNQLRDGSWGQQDGFLVSDRILNTLACVISLTIWNAGKIHVQRGLDFIRRQAKGMMEETPANGTSKVFEMVFHALLNESKSLGLDVDQDDFKQISERREANIKTISVERLHLVPTRVLYYLEGVQDIVDWKVILNLQSKDGCFLGSPSSTACVFLHTGDKKCLEFLTTLLSKFKDHAPCVYPVDICERLRAVDNVERLGIDRYFQTEIKQALDYVFRYWDKRGVGFGRESLVPDIDCTATGLRLLRLHGYNVLPDVLENIKADELYGGGPSHMLSLYKCSQINFPEETLMREASAMAKAYLSEWMQSNSFSRELAVRKDLREEIEHALNCPWYTNFPRLMVRNHIEHFSSNQFWMEKTLYQMPNLSDERYLELAKLDFNRAQALHQMEIKEISGWYKKCGFSELKFTRHRQVEIHFSAAVVMFEPEYSACRIAYTKAASLLIILDDLFDAHVSFDQVKLFTEAVKRWDLSLLDHFTTDMKICYVGLYNTVNELGQEALKAQGRDVLPYLRSVWEDLLSSTTKEAKWAHVKCVPPLREYVENAKVSIGLASIILNSIFFTGEPLPDEFLSQLDFRAPFLHLVCLTARLMNDARTFTLERDRGELVSFIQCYKHEHPELTEEEILSRLYDFNQKSLTELTYEFLKPGMIPKCYRKLLFDTARVSQFVFKSNDGFGVSVHEMQDNITKFLVEPVV